MSLRALDRLRSPPAWFLPLTLAVFVLAWPLERRHLWYTSYSLLTGRFTEAATMALYTSDLAFLLLLTVWLWERCSRRNSETPPRGVPRSITLASVGILLWAFMRSFSVPSDTSLTILGFYSTARIAQGALLMLIVSDVWRKRVLTTVLLWTLVSVGTTQGVLGVSQVFHGSDFGLRIFGEQARSVNSPGIAKVNVPAGTLTNSPEVVPETDVVPAGTIKKTLRAYGTLPHPNILGGVLLACLAATFGILISKNSSVKTFFGYAALGTTLFGIIGSFSRSAWMALFSLMSGSILCSYGNISSKRLKQLTLFSIIIIILVIILSNHIRETAWSRIVPVGTDQFITARSESFRDFASVIQGRFLIGVGNGIGFIETFRNVGNIDRNEQSMYNGTEREYWQYQYPHSVPLVIILELGIVGLGLMGALVLRILSLAHARFREAWTPVRRLGTVFLVLGILVPLLADHYLWTSQQGRILLWGLLGTILGIATAPLPVNAPQARVSRSG